MKISRNYENENFAATLLLHNLPSATHPPLLSARRFFNAVRQCYLEMKTNKVPYFSILSSIILWLRSTPSASPIGLFPALLLAGGKLPWCVLGRGVLESGPVFHPLTQWLLTLPELRFFNFSWKLKT